MKIILALAILAGALGLTNTGGLFGAVSSPPPAACGADSGVANRYKAALTKYLTMIDRTSFGMPFPPGGGAIVQVTTKNTCNAAIAAYNAPFPAGHPSRIAAGIYLFKIGTNRYAVKNFNLMHFYDTSWNLLFAVSGD
jgi:hypothetical protein